MAFSNTFGISPHSSIALALKKRLGGEAVGASPYQTAEPSFSSAEAPPMSSPTAQRNSPFNQTRPNGFQTMPGSNPFGSPFASQGMPSGPSFGDANPGGSGGGFTDWMKNNAWWLLPVGSGIAQGYFQSQATNAQVEQMEKDRALNAEHLAWQRRRQEGMDPARLAIAQAIAARLGLAGAGL